MERGQAVMLIPYSGLREFGGEAVDLGDLAGELGSGAGREEVAQFVKELSFVEVMSFPPASLSRET